MRTTMMILLAGLAAPGFADAMDCSQPVQQPLQATVIAPVAGELAMVYNQLGTAGGVLSKAYDQSQSVDQVLLRIQTESCNKVATTTPATGVVDPGNPAAYKPRTEFDNAPWRFNMNQNGKNMTADEFTAWMKDRGVRVARGRAAPAPVAAQVPELGEVPATTVAPKTDPAATQGSELMPVDGPEGKSKDSEQTPAPQPL